MRKMRKLVIMVCIAAMIMTNIPNWDAGADVSGTAPSEAGDTVVGNATVWKDEVITLNGNLTVNETGNLTLDNVTLLMNCATNGSYHIEVQSGGEMYILNNSNISSANEYHYLFWVRNDSKFEMRDSELSRCGYEWENPSNRGLTIETDNAIIENSTISKNYVGISIQSSLNSSITNCAIYNNSYHGVSLFSSSNNKLINCAIYNNSWQGVFLDSSSENSITNCAVYNNHIGVYPYYSSNNTIADCRIYNNSYFGVELYFSTDNTITNCEIYNSFQHGIWLVFSSHNLITRCAIYNSTYHGIIISGSSNNNITNCDIYNNSDDGIGLHESSNNQITSCAVYNNFYGINLEWYSSSNYIINSTITNSTNYDFYLDQNSQLTSLNTAFNKTSVHFADANSTLNVSWYLDVNVLWNNSVPAEYADVTVFDNLVNEVFSGSTDKNGLIKDIVVQEYTQNQTAGKTSFTPHNVTASQGGISVWDDNVTVDETKTVWLILDHNAPEINETTISPEQELTTDENTTTEFEFNVSHPDNLTLTYHWYLYMNETEVKNATGTLENTTVIQKINWTHYFDFTSHGNYTVKVEVFDGNANVSVIWVLTVNDVNGKPEIEFYYPPKDIILSNHSCVIFNVTASDPDNNDEISYQWTSNGAPVSNENKYIFYAEYNASGNATNTYLIELVITDNGTPPKSVNHTWTVTVVDIEALYADLLNQTELLEELTGLISKISYVCANLNQSNLDELNITLHGFYEKYNVLLNQTGLLGNIKTLMEKIENLTEQISESQNNAANLSSMLDELNITLEQLNVNLAAKWDALNTTSDEKDDAENAKANALKEKDEAIEAKNKAEYELGASVVCAVIGGIIAGFLVSFLLRRKLPKKG